MAPPPAATAKRGPSILVCLHECRILSLWTEVLNINFYRSEIPASPVQLLLDDKSLE